MKSNLILGAFAAFLSLSIGNTLSITAEEPKLDEQYALQMTRAKACCDCQLQCDMCFKHCLSLAKDKIDHNEYAQICLDCGACCKLAASLTARKSVFATEAYEFCAKCCDKCALVCEKFLDDKPMSDCAKACRECAKACRVIQNNGNKK